MTQPPSGGPGVSDGDAGGWRAPESAPERPGQWGQPAVPNWGTPPPSGPPGWAPAAYDRPPTGIVPLRPLSVGEILDGAFQAVRANPRTMVGTSAAVIAVVTVLSVVPEALLLNRLRDNPALTGGSVSLNDELDLLGGAGAARIVTGVLTFVAVTMLEVLLIVPVSEAVLGRRMDAGAMRRRARGRLLAALGLALLRGLVMVLAVVVLLLPGIVALAAGWTDVGAILLIAGLAGTVVLLFLLYTLVARRARARARERVGDGGDAPVLAHRPGQHMARLRHPAARRDHREHRAGGDHGTVGLLAGLPAAGQASPYESLPITFAQVLISGVGTIVAGAIFYPFSAAVSALLYIDLRMRWLLGGHPISAARQHRLPARVLLSSGLVGRFLHNVIPGSDGCGSLFQTALGDL